MSLAIVSRSLSDTTKRWAVANGQVARLMELVWTRIRIGFHYGLTDPGANVVGTPRFWLGLLSNPQADENGELSNGVLNAVTSHFVGIRTNYTTWTRLGSTIIHMQVNNAESMRVTRKVGSTVTMITSDKRAGWIADPDNRRSVVLLEITKGSPNWSFQYATLRGDQNLGDNATYLVDIPYSRFVAAMEVSTLAGAVASLAAGANFIAGSVFSMAVDEADGVLNAVHFAWDRTNPVFEVDSIIVSNFPD